MHMHMHMRACLTGSAHPTHRAVAPSPVAAAHDPILAVVNLDSGQICALVAGVALRQTARQAHAQLS